MKVLSVNVGGPRLVEWRGEQVRTSIWKAPVAGRVAVRGSNLAGDEQSDLRVHGGVEKAVYVYPHEHYTF
jgi:MOSC domain-containing protein YiiM